MIHYQNLFVLFCCGIFFTRADFNTVSTTTQTYEIDVPGSDPIRIIEGEPLWKTSETSSTLKPQSRFEHRSFTTDTTRTNLNNPVEHEDDNQNFSDAALQEFLNNYAETIRKNKPGAQEEQTSESDALPEDKSKSWNLLHVQRHKHPYEDKKGWVSLEPVPWSVSKISKWQSNQKPTQRPWNEYGGANEKPWENDFGGSNESPYNNPKPHNPYDDGGYNQNNYDHYYNNNNNQKPDLRPVFPRPSAVYSQTVHLEQAPDYSSNYPRPSYHKKPINGYYKHQEEDCKHDENGDIITDGLPPNFPSSNEEKIRRRGTEIHPESHPFSGDGEWVLLSTTKGYKYPKTRQRSLDIHPESIGTHRAVRLTVLPPLKGSKINMTTSHGGLLQVESTFETVEQAHNKYVKRQKLKQQKPKRKLQKVTRPKPVRQVSVSPTVATVPRNTGGDTSAVLAAVGAGLIPATMAMLVPMAMNGRRRRRDAGFVTSYPDGVEITLPRNL